MAEYALRDKSGAIKALFPLELGDEIIANVPGEWGTVSFEGKVSPRYTILKLHSMILTHGGSSELTLFIWEGDTLDRRGQ